MSRMPTTPPAPVRLARLVALAVLSTLAACATAPPPAPEPSPAKPAAKPKSTANPLDADLDAYGLRLRAWGADQKRRAGNNTPRPEAFLDGGVAACPADGSNRVKLAGKLTQLSKDLRSYRERQPLPKDGWQPLAARIRALLEEPCLSVAKQELGEPFQPQSRAALLDWWPAGHSWLRDHLQAYQGHDNVARKLRLAPRLRPSVDARSLPNDPLPHLLCSDADAPCDGPARGWHLRTTTALADHRRLAKSRRTGRDPARWDRLDACIKKVDPLDPADRYFKWHACLTRTINTEPQWPLQSYKAPTDGWLIILGRRGHYNFCDEIRAYDLASGSAYIAQSCSGLHFSQNQPGVDHDATADASRYGVLTGQVSVEAIRETAWMLFMLRHTQRFQYPRRTSLPLLGDIHVGRRSKAPMPPPQQTDKWLSSADTELRWAYLRAGTTLANGQITWFNGNGNPADSHALDLLRVAEAGLSPGCAPASAPTKLPLNKLAPGVSSLDSAKHLLDATYAELLKRYQSAAKTKCGTGKVLLQGSRVRMVP